MMRSKNQLETFGELRDRADAAAIHSIYVGLQKVRQSHKSFAHRAAREAIQKIWQEPRMPKRRFAHNKPLDYPWSPDARDIYFGGVGVGKLVLEHVTPISHLRDDIFDAVVDSDCSGSTIYDMLIRAHTSLSFTIITRDEDKIINKAGLRTSLSTGEGEWARYEQALGINENHFMAITSDPRSERWMHDRFMI